MSFPMEIIKKAWNRAGGRCEVCRKELVWDNHSEGERGAWDAHHIKAKKDGGEDTLSNCRILCLDCHKETPSYGSHS